MFTSIFRKNAALGVADADDEAAILDAIVEKTEAAAVTAAEQQPELPPVAIDYFEAHHTQAELEEVREKVLAAQSALKQLSEKYHRIGIKTEPGKWALYAVPMNGGHATAWTPVSIVPNDLSAGMQTFLRDCCRERKPEQKWVPPPPKPNPSEEATAQYKTYIQERLGRSYEEIGTPLSPKEFAELISRQEVPIPRLLTERMG